MCASHDLCVPAALMTLASSHQVSCESLRETALAGAEARAARRAGRLRDLVSSAWSLWSFSSNFTAQLSATYGATFSNFTAAGRAP